MFIDADKIEDPQRRMTTIRKLLRDLPEHHFETLKYLMQHLKKIVDHSEINKMEAKNLAIVFGPTLVRASGSRDNMVTMVTDMSHQCRIVESLLNNVSFFCAKKRRRYLLYKITVSNRYVSGRLVLLGRRSRRLEQIERKFKPSNR